MVVHLQDKGCTGISKDAAVAEASYRVTSVQSLRMTPSLAPVTRRETGPGQEGECKESSRGDSDVSKVSPEAQMLAQGR